MSELKAKLEDFERSTYLQSPTSSVLENAWSQISIFMLKNFEQHRLENSSVAIFKLALHLYRAWRVQVVPQS